MKVTNLRKGEVSNYTLHDSLHDTFILQRGLCQLNVAGSILKHGERRPLCTVSPTVAENVPGKTKKLFPSVTDIELVDERRRQHRSRRAPQYDCLSNSVLTKLPIISRCQLCLRTIHSRNKVRRERCRLGAKLHFQEYSFAI